jgi:hypothetical protein
MIKARSSSEGIAVCRITWAGFAIADVTQSLVEKAGVFSEAFACFDRRLTQAAKLLKLEVLP